MKWFRKSNEQALGVAMSGVKLGDRLLVIGCSDPLLIAALGAKAGLTGRVCAVDDDSARATAAGQIAEREGALVETAHAPGWAVPLDDASFDVVVVRDLIAASAAAGRHPLAEARRCLRPGGRCVIIEGSPKRGLASLVGGQGRSLDPGEAIRLLGEQGYVAARTLAERDGVVFVEGVKKNES